MYIVLSSCRSMWTLLSFDSLFSHVTLPRPQLTNMFFISQRDLGRDQTSPCGAWRGVPGQPGEGQHQPNSAGWASSAQVNKESTIEQDLSWVVCSADSRIHTTTTVCSCLDAIPVCHTYWNHAQISFFKNKVCQPVPRVSCVVRHSVRFGGKCAVLLCSTEGECFMADGGDRWWILWKANIKNLLTSNIFMLFLVKTKTPKGDSIWIFCPWGSCCSDSVRILVDTF